MTEKYLPIKIFEKRVEVDDRLTEAGGSSQQPKWVLTGSELRTKSNILFDEVHVARTQIDAKLKKYRNVPAVLKAKLNDNAIAKSHRNDLTQFLFTGKQDRVIGFTENQEILLRIDDASQVDELNQKLEKAEKYAKAISGIDALEVYQPEVKLPEKQVDKITFKIKLHNYSNYQMNKFVTEVFKELVSKHKELKYVKSVEYSDHLHIHQIVADSLDAIEFISDFNAISFIEPMPIFEVTLDEFSDDRSILLPAPVDGQVYPILGILDTGIAETTQLRPWLYGKRYSNYPNDFLDPAHGTFVSAIAAFGDTLEGQAYTGVNGCRLFDAAVYPVKDTITEADLVENVKEAIEKHGSNIKVWNMSLGSMVEVKEGEFSDFAVALDSIQEKNDVLIIKSAGNCSNFMKGAPTGRITRGADSVRALTVGSIAHISSSKDIAGVNHPSPFSRVGPGPANIIKPELVHYGGNAGVVGGNVVHNGVISLKPDGQVKKAIGTSFSAPRVASIAAELNNKLLEEFDSVLLKALILHSAKYPENVNLPINEKLNQYGFGVPQPINEILYNDPYEITLVMRDTLVKGEYVDIIDFPFPSMLVDENGFFTGQIIVTLASQPVFSEGQGAEYCQSDVQVMLGTYDDKVQRDIQKRHIRNELGREGTFNILLSSSYSKKQMMDNLSFSKTEKMLVQYGDKFYPNKKYAVDLSDITNSNKEKYLKSPKKWFLKITGLYRDFIEKYSIINRLELSQEYCVVITIRDPRRKTRVYDEVATLLQANQFLHRDVKLRTDVPVRIDI
ncbi:S8 family peptidase [Paenibacillus ferrarius]|uniref:S8 family peptidase n=1 Tax=Paenibacillus ferrarius TaxID=1469647 RepID=UPI003D2B19A9